MAKCNITVSLSEEDRALLSDVNARLASLESKVELMWEFFEVISANASKVLHA